MVKRLGQGSSMTWKQGPGTFNLGCWTYKVRILLIAFIICHFMVLFSVSYGFLHWLVIPVPSLLIHLISSGVPPPEGVDEMVNEGRRETSGANKVRRSESRGVRPPLAASSRASLLWFGLRSLRSLHPHPRSGHECEARVANAKRGGTTRGAGARGEHEWHETRVGAGLTVSFTQPNPTHEWE